MVKHSGGTIHAVEKNAETTRVQLLIFHQRAERGKIILYQDIDEFITDLKPQE